VVAQLELGVADRDEHLDQPVHLGVQHGVEHLQPRLAAHRAKSWAEPVSPA
jgi:hypothetical protein